MRWSDKDNRWASREKWTCDTCAKDFYNQNSYTRHINYDYNKKSFPRGMQTASQILILGLLAKQILS